MGGALVECLNLGLMLPSYGHRDHPSTTRDRAPEESRTRSYDHDRFGSRRSSRETIAPSPCDNVFAGVLKPGNYPSHSDPTAPNPQGANITGAMGERLVYARSTLPS